MFIPEILSNINLKQSWLYAPAVKFSFAKGVQLILKIDAQYGFLTNLLFLQMK